MLGGEVAHSVVPPVEGRGVGDVEMAHEITNVAHAYVTPPSESSSSPRHMGTSLSP